MLPFPLNLLSLLHVKYVVDILLSLLNVKYVVGVLKDAIRSEFEPTKAGLQVKGANHWAVPSPVTAEEDISTWGKSGLAVA